MAPSDNRGNAAHEAAFSRIFVFQNGGGGVLLFTRTPETR
jgi:hypothetical protein